MYKFSSLHQAVAAPMTWSSLVVGVALAVAAPAQAQTTAATKSETTTSVQASSEATAEPTTKSATTVKTGDTSSAAEATAEPPAEEPRRVEPTAEERQQAMKAFEAGSKAFADADYETAVAEFKKAYQIIPSPHAEYWIAVSMDKADPETKDPKALARAYETFLSNPGAGHVGAEQVETSTSRLNELRAMLPATVIIVSDPSGAQVTINGEAKEGVTPLTVELPAGTYQVGLSHEGYDSATVEVKAEGGITLEQQVNLAKTVVAPPPVAAPVATEKAPEPRTKSMVPAIVTLSLGGAGLISGTIFGIMALNAKSKFKDDPTADHADAAERNALIADMSFGIALTLGLTGIVLLTNNDTTASTSAKNKTKKKGTEFAVAPYASPFGAGATARLRF